VTVSCSLRRSLCFHSGFSKTPRCVRGSAKDEAELSVVLKKLGKKLDRLEREIGAGPFFLGAEVSLVDAAFTPALQRLSWADEIHPAMAIFKGRPKITRWWSALADRDSVRGSTVHDLRERFHKMIGRDRGGYRSVVGARVAG
jgi:glutathione S-transferase